MKKTSDQQAIMDLLRIYERAHTESDVDLLADVCDEDIVVMPAFGQSIVGKPDLLGHQREFLSRLRVSIDAEPGEIEIRDDLAYASGMSNIDLTNLETGDTDRRPITWVHVYRKRQAGQWKIWRLIYNYNEPVSA